MNYKDIEKLVDGKEFPLMGKNEYGECVLLERGEDENGRFYRTTVAQHNDWCRINTYYENGSIDETYEK